MSDLRLISVTCLYHGPTGVIEGHFSVTSDTSVSLISSQFNALVSQQTGSPFQNVAPCLRDLNGQFVANVDLQRAFPEQSVVHLQLLPNETESYPPRIVQAPSILEIPWNYRTYLSILFVYRIVYPVATLLSSAMEPPVSVLEGKYDKLAKDAKSFLQNQEGSTDWIVQDLNDIVDACIGPFPALHLLVPLVQLMLFNVAVRRICPAFCMFFRPPFGAQRLFPSLRQFVSVWFWLALATMAASAVQPLLDASYGHVESPLAAASLLEAMESMAGKRAYVVALAAALRKLLLRTDFQLYLAYIWLNFIVSGLLSLIFNAAITPSYFSSLTASPLLAVIYTAAKCAFWSPRWQSAYAFFTAAAMAFAHVRYRDFAPVWWVAATTAALWTVFLVCVFFGLLAITEPSVVEDVLSHVHRLKAFTG